MKLLRRPEPGTRSKHVDMRYLYLKEQVDGGVVHLVHEGTDSMVADMLTKPLGPRRSSFRMRSGCCKDRSFLWVVLAWTERSWRMKVRTTWSFEEVCSE